MSDIERSSDTPTEKISAELALAFAPLHKRALGMAVGTMVGLAVAAATVGALVLPGADQFVGLLVNFFPGYSLSIPGVAIGFLWGMFCGFVAGWFTAFVRNLVVASSIWLARTKAELAATRDFLDHI